MRYENANGFKAENGHEIKGIWYPRVTRILSIKAKPALDNFLKEIGDYGKAEDIKNKSAEEGSLLHETIQNFLTGKPAEIPETARPALEAFTKFNKERKIRALPDFVERLVWSMRHRYAGTVDALAEIDGKFGVLDIKTSTGFYPEYNLQTAAYASALQEFEIKRTLALNKNIETRWILKIDQRQNCLKCGATLRTKGGRHKVRNGKTQSRECGEKEHAWGEMLGNVELREFPYMYKDFKAFVAAKILWEWENDYWLKQVGYLR